VRWWGTKNVVGKGPLTLMEAIPCIVVKSVGKFWTEVVKALLGAAGGWLEALQCSGKGWWGDKPASTGICANPSHRRHKHMLMALYALMTLCGTQKDCMEGTCTERFEEDTGATDADKTCLLYWAFCLRLEKPVSYSEELQRGNMLQGAIVTSDVN